MLPKQKKTLLGDKNVPRAIVSEHMDIQRWQTSLFYSLKPIYIYINQLLIKEQVFALCMVYSLLMGKKDVFCSRVG